MGGQDYISELGVATVEVFTPGQTCHMTLAPMRVTGTDPVLAFIAGVIYACLSLLSSSVTFACYIYSPSSNTWSGIKNKTKKS
jgi:hypothetical protein